MYAFWIFPKEAFQFLVQIWKVIAFVFLQKFFNKFSTQFTVIYVHMVDVHAFYIRVQAFVKHSDLLSNCPFALESQNTKKMHLHVICLQDKFCFYPTMYTLQRRGKRICSPLFNVLLTQYREQTVIPQLQTRRFPWLVWAEIGKVGSGHQEHTQIKD